MKKIYYGNGKFLPREKAAVLINDLGVLRGYGVFDFLKTVNGGKPFLWAEHWRRFKNSAKQLGLRVPVGENEVKKIIASLLKKNKTTDASIRLLLTGGATEDGMSISKPLFFILLEELYTYPARLFSRGAKVTTHEHARLVPEAKTTNYLTAIRLQKLKKKNRAVEILYVHNGRVLECATSNFFIVKNGKLVTPQSDVLPGTTRGLLIKLAREAGLEVEEREVKTEELKTADEAFLTATNKNVMPIVQIDDLKIADGKVGDLTKKLMKCYAEFVAGY